MGAGSRGGHIRRSAVPVAAVLALAAGGVLAAAGPAAAVTSAAPVGGGWLATPATVHSAQITDTVHVHVRRARVNHSDLGAVSRHRQRQVRAGHPSARASRLAKDGSFTITVAS